ncbi:MAG: HAMP domain-containing sensor histidine kinase, partial [SAR324 cluster bacterium]|nr:HAMP domain-containing sensor histidine kinase [SAR324 cluster bacterium]
GLILAGTWLTLRWIMRPLNWLSDGVSALGKGDLEHRLPEKRRDELGNLARAFNRMSYSIKEMLTAREQLLLDVSHELRSPLTRMKVALEFIPENSSQVSLQSDVQEMEQMVTEILETERLKSEYGKLNRMDTDLVTLIGETCLMFEGKSPGISFEKSVEKCVANVDVEQIKTVLKNILANAHKYSTSENDPIKVSLSMDESEVQLKIQDYGQGIPDEEMDLIFEPFYRVDKSRNKNTGGYGLGLSLCKTIVEAHGGTIFVKSNMGQGTIFLIILPNYVSTI